MSTILTVASAPKAPAAQSPKLAGLTLISVLLATCAYPTVALAQDSDAQAQPARLEEIVVTGERQSPAASSTERARTELARVPGGATVLDGSRINEGPVSTLEDALAYAPGLFAAQPNGSVGNGARLSMRGSDLNSSFSPLRGVKILWNGAPLTMANGFLDPEQIPLFAIERVEVFRGANALEYGATNLGGAVNFVSPTGYSARRPSLTLGFGSRDERSARLSAGTELGDGWDAYGSFAYTETDGFRQRGSAARHLYGYINLGKRWSENHETRLNIDLQDHRFEQPDALTKAQLEADPEQNPRDNDAPATYPVYRVDLRHTVLVGNMQTISVGGWYHRKRFEFPVFGAEDFDDWREVGVNFRHTVDTSIGGMRNRFVWGGLAQWMTIEDRKFIYPFTGALNRSEDEDRDNFELFAQNELDLTDRVRLITGVQAARSVQAIEQMATPETATRPVGRGRRSFSSVSPKLGILWQPAADVQLFANVSRSFEPPHLSTLRNLRRMPAYESQRSTTVEIGTRARLLGLSWDIAAYRARLRDELFFIETPVGSRNFIPGNIERSIHQGVEVGVDGDLMQGVIGGTSAIRLRAAYTFNDFRADGDPTFGDNRLAGVPEHFGRAEAMLQSGWGWSIGPNISFASSTWVDFANTLKADGYVLVGVRGSYDIDPRLRLSFEARNLTDERYAAAVASLANAGGVDQAQFYPGAGRSATVNLELRF